MGFEISDLLLSGNDLLKLLLLKIPIIGDHLPSADDVEHGVLETELLEVSVSFPDFGLTFGIRNAVTGRTEEAVDETGVWTSPLKNGFIGGLNDPAVSPWRGGGIIDLNGFNPLAHGIPANVLSGDNKFGLGGKLSVPLDGDPSVGGRGPGLMVIEEGIRELRGGGNIWLAGGDIIDEDTGGCCCGPHSPAAAAATNWFMEVFRELFCNFRRQLAASDNVTKFRRGLKDEPGGEGVGIAIIEDDKECARDAIAAEV